MNLRVEIENAKKVVYSKEAELRAAQHELHKLTMLQYSCAHEFTPPHKNYVHEGGTCKLCGINQLYAECQKIGAKWSDEHRALKHLSDFKQYGRNQT